MRALVLLVALGVVPDVVEKEQDLRRQRDAVGAQLAAMLMADEHPEDVRFPSLGQDVLVGQRLVAHRHRFGRAARVQAPRTSAR